MIKLISKYCFLIGSTLVLSSFPARAAGTYGFNITLDGNQFFNQVKDTIGELIQAFTDANKPGAFAGSQLDIFDEPTDFRFNLSGIGAVSKDEKFGLNYSGKNWKTSGSLSVERNKDCSGVAIPNCYINTLIGPSPLADSETAFLKVVSAQVIHFNNEPINQLENVIHGIPPILALGPINFQAADYFISQNGGFRTVNKIGNIGICDVHKPDPHKDCADAFFDQISIQRTPVGLFPEIINDADYEINGFTYTVRATHTDSVPGPLPLLGIGVAFDYTRKLRRMARTLKLK